MDILTRHIQGGLKLGGPKKQLYYKVNSGDFVAEMGAFRGYYCMMLAKQVGSNGRVIAIEPVNCPACVDGKFVQRPELRELGLLPILQPGEERGYEIEFGVLEGKQEIEELNKYENLILIIFSNPFKIFWVIGC